MEIKDANLLEGLHGKKHKPTPKSITIYAYGAMLFCTSHLLHATEHYSNYSDQLTVGLTKLETTIVTTCIGITLLLYAVRLQNKQREYQKTPQ